MFFIVIKDWWLFVDLEFFPIIQRTDYFTSKIEHESSGIMQVVLLFKLANWGFASLNCVHLGTPAQKNSHNIYKLQKEYGNLSFVRQCTII